ncbi:MAG: pre-peptidase C-terminal domain-containing protein [Anaerolineae bacterium]|nr:pre-peptidase C-terminal domain-containing protein [Anaerolineae bacterium]
MRVLPCLCLFTLLTTFNAWAVSAAQVQDTLPYEWETANIGLRYPANWDVPLPTEVDGQPTLQLAQVLVDTPANVRPPAIPIITLTRIPGAAPADQNLTSFLMDALQSLNLESTETPTTAAFLSDSAPQLTGTSADGQFFGIARAAPIGSSAVLIISGRAVDAQQSDFEALFDAVAASVTVREEEGGQVADQSTYGVLWHTQRSLEDGDEGFLDLVGLAYGPDNHLYTYERDLGMVALDATTGSILSITPNEHILEPSDLDVADDGSVYVADRACGCIFTLGPDGRWLDEADAEADSFDPETSPGMISGFEVDTPAHLAVGTDGALYATSITSANTMSVVVYINGVREREIRLGDNLFEQPLLAAAASGQVYALTQFGELLELSGGEAASIDSLGTIAAQLNDVAITPDGNLVVATQNQGILVLTSQGDLIDQPGSIVPNFPLPGEMVSPIGVAVDNQGRLYFADSDGTFGAITAMSTGVAPDRMGSPNLIPGLGVQGILSEAAPRQQWTYRGAAGERITLTTVDTTPDGALNVAVRLLDPSGAEIAYNDDHTSPDIANLTDAQLADFPLPVDGQYIVVVEGMEGAGTYGLGLSQTHMLTQDSSGIARASGDLSGVFPVALYELSGSSGQTLTITLEAGSGSLDPVLRLIGPDGALAADNDDADDRALGNSAQIVNFALPASGVYRIEAARFDGTGHYNLAVVSAS